MNLSPIRIENDVYLDRWIETLIPLVNKNNILEHFWAENGLEKFGKKENKQPFLHFEF